MKQSTLSQNGLVSPHVHYSFLKTASEGLLLSEEEYHSNLGDSRESDCESLIQEKQYQFELQERIQRGEEQMHGQSCHELEEDSLDEASREEEHEESDEEQWPCAQVELNEEETPIPSGSHFKNRNCYNSASNKGETADRYFELRYNPNWKEDEEGAGHVEFKKSYPDDDKSSPNLSVSSTCSSSPFRFIPKNSHFKEQPPNAPSEFGTQFSPSCEQQSANVGSGSTNRTKEGDLPATGQSSCIPTAFSNGSSVQTKIFKQQRAEKYFVEKNKLTLGFAVQKNTSYLQLHDKRKKESGPGQAHQNEELTMGQSNPDEASSLKSNSVSGSSSQPAFGAQVELRSHHNALEFENPHGNSNSHGEAPAWKQEDRQALHCRLYSNPSLASLWPSPTNSSTLGQEDPANFVHQHGLQNPMTLAFARNALQPCSYQNSPLICSPCAGEKNTTYQLSPENVSGCQQQYQHRCTASEAHSITRHGKPGNLLGQRGFLRAYNAGRPQPINESSSSCIPRSISTETIPHSHVSGNSGSSQPPARSRVRASSPTTQLIQAVERHHREISQLADDPLSGSQFASMFPPIILRGDSDSQLNVESSEGRQRILNRSNSEGYLLQMEKQTGRKEKENRKGSRTKGYIKMDVKLGGLGTDYETIREKSEKIKQQKEYAKHVKVHNMKNFSSARRPPARRESKLSVSRQKALEYAKTIPKPKLFLSRPSEQEPKDEKILARTLNGENLPPISSLESLQNRHEKEKQVVAAFKTLHIV